MNAEAEGRLGMLLDHWTGLAVSESWFMNGAGP
jgi:hypothetical protein